MCDKLKFDKTITFTWKMTVIARWNILKIPLKLIILMTNETLKLVQSKWDSGPNVPIYIINIFMDPSI
jgi:hypothetical protein